MTKLAKLFLPHAQPHELRRRVHALYFAIGFGVIGAILVAGILYWMYYGDRFRP
jgi:hypothetical protein